MSDGFKVKFSRILQQLWRWLFSLALPACAWILLLVFLSSGRLHAKAIGFEESESKPGIEIIRQAILLHPRESSPKRSDVVSGSLDSQFIETDKRHYGYAAENAWLKIDLKNNRPEAKKVILLFDYAPLDYVDAFEPRARKPFARAGDMVPSKAKALSSFINALPIDVAPESESSIYVHVRTSSVLDTTVRLLEVPDFHKHENYLLFATALLLGGFLIMCIYNFIIAYSIWRWEYTAYSFFILFSGIRESYFSALLPHFFIDDPKTSHMVGALGYILSLAVGAYFSKKFLDLKRKSPRLDVAYNGIIAATFLIVLLLLIQGFSLFVARSTLVVIFIVTFFTVFVGWYQVYKGSKEARYFAVAFTVACSGFIGNALMATGLISLDRFSNIFAFSTQYMEIVLLGLAFGEKIKRVRLEKYQTTKKYQKQLETFNDDLKQQVQMKTADINAAMKILNAKTTEMTTIFHSSMHALFKVQESADGEIVIANIRSDATNSIFGLDPSATVTPFRQAVLEKSSLPPFMRDDLLNALRVILNQDPIAYELNQQLLRDDLIVTVNGVQKTLKLKWAPLLGPAGDVLESLLVTAEEITNHLEIERRMTMEKDRNTFLLELFQAHKPLSIAFIASAKNLLQKAHRCAHDPLTPEMLKELFRYVHTIKGNSNFPGFKRITAMAHDLESLLSEQRKSQLIQMESAFLQSELDKIAVVIADYETVMRELSWFDESDSEIGLSTADFVKLIDQFPGGISQLLQDFDKDSNINKVFHELYPSVHSLLRRAENSAMAVALNLNKPMPWISLEGVDIHLNAATALEIENAFNHLIHNSLDHGIETPQERFEKGKAREGTIRVISRVDDRSVHFDFEDDGCGLNIASIREKASAMGLPIDDQSDLEVANLIFLSGLSTKDRATQYSGRGVGMNAVAESLRQMQGDIAIELGAKRPDGFSPIRFVLRLPRDLAKHVPDEPTVKPLQLQQIEDDEVKTAS